MLLFHQARDVDEVGEVVQFVLVYLLLDGLDLCQDGVADFLELSDIPDREHVPFLDVLIYHGREHVLALLNNLEKGHVEFDLGEDFGAFADDLNGVEFLDDGVVFGEGDVLHVDHDLFERHVILASQRQLHLHRLHQHFVDALVLDVELPFLVVQSIQNRLQVRYLR